MPGNQDISFERLMTMSIDDRRAQLNNMDFDRRIAFAEFQSTYVAPAEPPPPVAAPRAALPNDSVARLEAELATLTTQAAQQQRQLQAARTAGQQLLAQLPETQSSISLVERNNEEYARKRATLKGEQTALAEALERQTTRVESERMPQQAAEDQLNEQISEAVNMEQTRRAAEDRLNEARRRGPRLASFEELQKVTDNFGSRGRLGAGGQGEVWKAVWKGVQVVIKRMPEYDMIGELNESGVINLDTVNRGAATITAGKNQGFIQELIALSTIQHPNVIPIIAFNNIGCPENRNYLVLPLCKGGDLEHAIKMGARWDARVVYMRDACRGLLALHTGVVNPTTGKKKSFLHMDIKPANILIDHGRAMLADCGLAMEMVKVKRAGSDTQTMMGNWGQCVGTPFFIDPQYQYVSSSRAGEYHRYSDVYSMGVTLLLVLTGLDVRFKVGTKGSGKSENKNTVVWCHENYDTIFTAGEGDTMTVNRELGPHHPVDFVKTNVNDRNCSTFVKRSIADPVAGWPADKAAAVFKLGMDMIEYSPYKRPSVEQCEERLSSVLY